MRGEGTCREDMRGEGACRGRSEGACKEGGVRVFRPVGKVYLRGMWVC